MPLSRLTTNFHWGEQHEEVLEAYHDCMIRTLGIKPSDRLMIIDERPGGMMTPTDTPGRYVLVEISLFTGRSVSTKRRLYRELVDTFTRLGIDPLNCRIVLYESPRENWGIRGGKAASDVELGYRVEV